MTTPTKFGVSYFGNRFLSHGAQDIARIAESCDYVVHTVSEADLNFHKSVLAKLFAESRRRGLEVWADPWGLGGTAIRGRRCRTAAWCRRPA